MIRCVANIVLIFLFASIVSSSRLTGNIHRYTAVISRNPSSTIIPKYALGACVDGLSHRDVSEVYTKPNLSAMINAGYQSLAYRLRTELGVEIWRWNQEGSWSDRARKQGYWRSSSKTDSDNMVSNGYKLSRRGDTIDQANNDGYSRIDDGIAASFWKSNPYLDAYYTREPNSLHPQWILVDLGEVRSVNMIRIFWGIPYAVRYQVSYWKDADSDCNIGIDDTFETNGWHTFPNGSIYHGKGGDVSFLLSHTPVRARLIRIWMTASSDTAPRGSMDVRDGLGYAVRELSIGLCQRRFHDWIIHSSNGRIQTPITVSSTDPWSSNKNRDLQVEQPGFDTVLHSGLTHDNPVLLPVGILYNTPENAAAELKWFLAKGVPLRFVELGEEPDGQYCSPEDYGALFLQWSRALLKEDPAIRFIGPGFQTEVDDVFAWTDKVHSDRSWVRRFLNYLKVHKSLNQLKAFSFEWYPFGKGCEATHDSLQQAPMMLVRMLHRWRVEGVPGKAPFLITEYGYSSFAVEPEVDRAGALFDAETVAQFLTIGGRAAYFYGYEPQALMHERNSRCWGVLSLLLSDSRHRIKQPLAAYYAARMITQIWASPQGHPISLFAVHCRSSDGKITKKFTAYAALHPDRNWAILLLNKDYVHTIHVRLPQLKGAARITLLSSKNYRWRPDSSRGYASPDIPPFSAQLNLTRSPYISLPPCSLGVITVNANNINLK